MDFGKVKVHKFYILANIIYTREVYPQAVSFDHNVVPNVFELAKDFSYNPVNQELSVQTNKKHEFKNGR